MVIGVNAALRPFYTPSNYSSCNEEKTLLVIGLVFFFRYITSRSMMIVCTPMKTFLSNPTFPDKKAYTSFERKEKWKEIWLSRQKVIENYYQSKQVRKISLNT